MSNQNPQNNLTLFDLIQQFPPRLYKFNEQNNRPEDEETYERIEKFNRIQKLAYALFAKPFVLQPSSDPKLGTTSEQVNHTFGEYNLGPLSVRFIVRRDINTQNKMSFIPGFHQIKKTGLSKDDFINKYKKNLTYSELVNLNIRCLETASNFKEPPEPQSYINEAEMMSSIQYHFFKPILGLIGLYNQLKNPNLPKNAFDEYVSFMRKLSHQVYGITDFDSLESVKVLFDSQLETRLAAFGMTGKADFCTGYYLDSGSNSASKCINMMHILEAKMPATNVLRYFKNILPEDEQDPPSSGVEQTPSSGQPAGRTDTIDGERNFIKCYNKLLYQMIMSNCTRGIITDYESLLFLEIGVDSSNELHLTYSFHETKSLSYMRYMIFIFLTIDDDYDRQQLEKQKVTQYVLDAAAANVGSRRSSRHRRNQDQLNRGDGSGRTDLTEFSSDLSADVIQESLTPETQADIFDDDLGEHHVKIFGHLPYEPREIAKSFRPVHLVLFNYNPHVVAVSKNELIRVDATIMLTLGYYDINITDQKLIIKLSPIESLFECVNYARNEDYCESESGRFSAGVTNIDQLSVDSIFKELVVHLKILHQFGDEFVVNVYHYGYLSDHTSYANTGKISNWRYNGAFILMQEVNAKPLTVEELRLLSLEFKERILNSYSKLHMLDIIHNDVKNSNILVTANGDVKIIDFGNSYESDKEDEKTAELLRVKYLLGL